MITLAAFYGMPEGYKHFSAIKGTVDMSSHPNVFTVQENREFSLLHSGRKEVHPAVGCYYTQDVKQTIPKNSLIGAQYTRR